MCLLLGVSLFHLLGLLLMPLFYLLALRFTGILSIQPLMIPLLLLCQFLMFLFLFGVKLVLLGLVPLV